WGQGDVVNVHLAEQLIGAPHPGSIGDVGCHGEQVLRPAGCDGRVTPATGGAVVPLFTPARPSVATIWSLFSTAGWLLPTVLDRQPVMTLRSVLARLARGRNGASWRRPAPPLRVR